MRIARRIFSRYNNLIFAVLEVWWRAYYNSAFNFEEVFALISKINTVQSYYQLLLGLLGNFIYKTY